MASEIVNQLKDQELDTATMQKYIYRLQTSKTYYKPDEDRKQYDGYHDILRRDPKTVEDEDGNKRRVDLNKLVFNFNQKIVETAIAFLFGKNAGLERDGEVNEDRFREISKAWKNAKMDYHIEEAVRDTMVETKSALLFYLTTNDNGETIFEDFGEAVTNRGLSLNVKNISHEKGDEFWSHFDSNGRMDAFVRKYTVPDYDRENYSLSEPTNIEKMEIYMDEEIIHIWKKQDENWDIQRQENQIGKIPVVYFDKDYPEWNIVQSLIDRVNWLNSTHSDTNDYFAFPAMVVRGKIKNMPSKGAVGKVYEVEGEETPEGATEYKGSVDFLEWTQSPESVENEYKKLINAIYTMTYTPDISFENMKGLGNVSGILLRLMFLDAKVKARNNERLYGQNIERAINLFKDFTALMAIPSQKATFRDMELKYRFDDIIPESESDLIENLVTSAGGKPIISQKTATENHPHVNDADQEQERLKEEQTNENPLAGGSFNI